MNGVYAFRLIIPVYMEGRILTFTTRDVTGQLEPTYKSQPTDRAIIDAKRCLYNVDRARGDVGVVLEGCLDVWRIGDNAVGTFGTEYTQEQVRILCKKFRKLYILFDDEDTAQGKARQLAWDCCSVIPKVEVLRIRGKKDPDSLTEDEAGWIRKELFGR